MKKNLLYLTLLLQTISYSQTEEITYYDLIDSYRKDVHTLIVNTSQTIDNLNSEELNKNIDIYNSSYGLLELSTLYYDSKVDFDSKVKLKLALPNIRNRLKLIIETNEKKESKDYIRNNNSDDLDLGLMYNKLIKNTLLNVKLAVNIKKIINPFIELEAIKKWNYNHLDFTLSQTFKESIVDNLESISYFKISKKLTKDLILNNYNEYYWHIESPNDNLFYHSIYLNQIITNDNLLTYQLDSNINNTDTNTRLKRYSAKIKYRHYVKDWLYTDIINEVYHLHENNFKSKYGLRFNLGIYFNKGKNTIRSF